MRRVLVALVMAAGCAAAQALPSFAEVKSAHRPSDLTLLDRHGEPLQTLRADPTVRRLPWVPITELSPALLQAIVLSEDRRFHEHSGVDWRAVAASAWANMWNTRTRGASTLTMQLAGLVDADLARPDGGRSVVRKIDQALAARRLEARWSKAQILEAYLNLAAFRGELVGIGALSQTLFGKHPSGLDAEEAAIAAALLRAPNAAPSAVAERACGVLRAQGQPCAAIEGLTRAALARRGGPPLGEQLAPHLARQVDTRAAKLDGTLATTLDARLQRLAVAALRSQLAELSGRNVQDGALLVLDNASGEVRAWVGSSGPLSDAAQVDGVLARRQPGSTLKPFVYQLAFERGLITPGTALHDAPAQIATANGLYLPRNYDEGYKGWVSARSALGASLNVPAVRVGQLLGADALFERLNAVGLDLPHGGGHYGASLALGSADVSLLALTNAYRTLANGGLHAPLRWQPGRSVAARRVADAAAVRQVADILSDNEARALTFGLDSVLATRGWAAVKTGTSKDLRDNWCVGYTDRYTVGVWVGNADGEAMHAVSGVEGAAPVWQRVVSALHEGAPSRRPPPLPASAAAPAIPSEPAPFGIAHPRDGSVFALDPDIPPSAQRIRFEGEAGQWELNGRRLGRGERLHWAPQPGRHRLRLLAADSRVLGSADFEVRGALWKAAVAPR